MTTVSPRPRFIAHYRKKDASEQSVSDHLQGVALASRSNAGKAGLQRAGEIVGLLHDLGKYSSEFQRYLKSATGLIDPDGDEYLDAGALKGKVDHSSAGAQYVWQQLRARPQLGLFAGQVLALCIASHHSGLIDCVAAERESFGEDTFTRRMSKAAAKTHLDEVLAAADPEILKRAAALLADEELLDEFKVLGANIAKIDGQSLITRQQQFGLIVRFLFSSLIDADRTDTASFEYNRPKTDRRCDPRWGVLAERLEVHLHGLQPEGPVDELRREISDQCLEASKFDGGIYTLTVPTGGGKTLASLRFALQHALRRKLDRILYVIPFTSIIDQNAEAIRKILEQTPEESGAIVLEHHSNLTPEHQSWREKLLSENWDAPVVLTTMVQVLDSLFGAGTRGARRMHQMANSVILFDEVQTLPIKCVHLFNNAVNFLAEQCNSTVVLCTATQPLLQEVEAKSGAIRLAAPHALVANTQSLFERLRRVEIVDERRRGEFSEEAVAALALQEMRRKGSCLVVVNTKKSARKVYEFASELPAGERVHLSTHMCPAHRKNRLDYVRRRLADSLPVLCVSTQLIEAGVDVDFGVVVRALAGIDSIAQAAGRCNRNGRFPLGTVHVVKIANENLGPLPEIQRAAKVAERVLDDFHFHPERYHDDLCGPQALDDYYRYYFFECKDNMSYPVSGPELGGGDTLLNLLSGNTNAVAQYRRKNGRDPSLYFRQAFSAAADAFKVIDAPTEGIVVPFEPEGRQLINELCAAYEVEKQYALLRRAQQFTVSVFPNVMEKLQASHAVFPIQNEVNVHYLDTRCYSDEYGLVTEQISGMEQLDA